MVCFHKNYPLWPLQTTFSSGINGINNETNCFLRRHLLASVSTGMKFRRGRDKIDLKNGHKCDATASSDTECHIDQDVVLE